MAYEKRTTPGTYGGTRVGYLEHEIDNWIRSRIRMNGTPVGEPIAAPPVLRIIKVREATRRTGLSRVQLWRLERDGKFPSRVRMVDDELVASGEAA